MLEKEAEVAYAEMLGKEIFYEENIPNLEIKGGGKP